MTWLIYVGVTLLIVLYGVSVYNRLVKKRNLVEEAWSGIDVQLKKRYNLIPNIVETVKAYASHEKNTLQSVVEARNAAQTASTIAEQQAAEKQLSRSINGIFAVAEQYPDLKSNTNFLQLQNELSNIEGNIEKARRYYNGTVREKNTLVESFPSSVLAQIYGFEKSEYFEIENYSERANPKVQF